MAKRFRLVMMLLISAGALASADFVWAKDCPELPKCRGCGCAGGPGYRGPNGRCVSHVELYKVCGNPPTNCCVFENAPNTDANKQCALIGLDETKLKLQARKDQNCKIPEKKFEFD